MVIFSKFCRPEYRLGCWYGVEKFSRQQMAEQIGYRRQAVRLNHLYSVYFVDHNTGWAVGGKEQSSRQQMEEQIGYLRQAVLLMIYIQ